MSHTIVADPMRAQPRNTQFCRLSGNETRCLQAAEAGVKAQALSAISELLSTCTADDSEALFRYIEIDIASIGIDDLLCNDILVAAGATDVPKQPDMLLCLT